MATNESTTPASTALITLTRFMNLSMSGYSAIFKRDYPGALPVFSASAGQRAQGPGAIRACKISIMPSSHNLFESEGGWRATRCCGAQSSGQLVHLLCLVGMVLLCTSRISSASPPSAFTEHLLAERLALMKDVAAWKWAHDRSIEDFQREEIVIASAVDEGLRYGFRIEATEQLFIAQIRAAKAIQHHWFSRWRQGQKAPPPVDLNSILRPRLLTLGSNIMSSLAHRQRPPIGEELAAPFDIEGLPVDIQNELMSALSNMRRYSERLEQVIDSGRLRVGMTGDYAPFTLKDDRGHWQGIDVELAEDLAQFLGADLKIVPTSWPALMEDLKAAHFDIAMGGITVTPERTALAAFALPVLSGGKTAIARCSERNDFARLEQIDHPDNRVIVNPGGTNEAFVRGRLHQAQILVYPDNRKIFEELVEGRADVMITDRIEVQLQTHIHPQLCATMEHTLTRHEKAFLLPPDEPHWQTTVNEWLQGALDSGEVDGVFARHGFSGTGSATR